MADNMTRAQQIGLGLQGFSAGLQGRGNQFNQQLQTMNQIAQQEEERRIQQEAQMQAQRQQAWAQDIGIMNQFYQEGDFGNIAELGVSRLQELQNFPGADPTDTQEVTQLAMMASNGDEEAGKILGEILGTQQTIFRGRGLLETPSAASPETDLGKIQADFNAGLINESEYTSLKSTALAGDPAESATPRTDLGKITADLNAGLINNSQAEILRSAAVLEAPERLADQRERKIVQYMEFFDKSREEAIRAVDSVIMPDDKGNIVRYDPISGTSEILSQVGVEAPTDLSLPDAAEVEDLAFDPAKGTGFGASFLGLWNSTLGQVPFLPIAEGPEEAAQELRVIERDAIRALASSSRPPVIEQQRIMSIIPDAMNWFENPEVAQGKMTNFINLMMNQYVDDMRFSSDLTNPKAIREESRARSNNIESIVRRVLTPEAAQVMFDSLSRVEQSVNDISGMSMEELQGLDMGSLSDEQLDIYIQRMSEN